jgi:hypothetical protein
MIIFSGTREAMSRYRMTPAKTEMVAGKLYATRNVWAGARAGANASCSACRSPRFVRRAADFTEASLRRHPADPDDSNDNCRVSRTRHEKGAANRTINMGVGVLSRLLKSRQVARVSLPASAKPLASPRPPSVAQLQCVPASGEAR